VAARPSTTPDAGRAAHTPVLAAELVQLLDPAPGQVAVDCTFGGGGHAELLAQRLGPAGTLVAIDRDPLAEQRFQTLAAQSSCAMRFIQAGHAEALALLADEGLRADIVYFDLGMSSMQVDTRERGFSYAYEAPLDMRMDPTQELSAREIVAEWDERRLAQTLRDYGEERHAGAIARAIVRRREQAPIDTTQALVDTITSAIPAPARFAGGHPAKRSFQALRIAVNDELGQLDRALPLAWRLLRVGGVLAGISFQSLEDRRVKRFLADRARGCVCPPELPVCVCEREPEGTLLTRSIVPSAQEVAENPRAASARPYIPAPAPGRRGARPRRPRRGARAVTATAAARQRAHVDRAGRVRSDRDRRAAIAGAQAQRQHRARARARGGAAALSIEGSELVAGGRVESRAQTLGMQLVPVGSLRFLTVHPRADARHAASALASASASTVSTTSSAGRTETSEGAGGETGEHVQASEGSTATAEAANSSATTQPGSDEAGRSSETTSAEAPATSGAAPAASTPSAQGGGEATTDAAGGTGPAGAE
jgi:16S rRNA (cytosine1402-N4)-methyltransferase